MQEPNASAGPGREVLEVLRRGSLTIAAVFVLVTGAVTFLTLRTPALYEAESSLMVRIGREYVYRPEIGRAEASRMPSLSEMVNSEVEILSSRDLAEQVVRQLGVEKLYPEILEEEGDPGRAAEVAVGRFRQAASVRPVLESSVIKVGFEHVAPEVAAEAVNLLVDRFRDKHVEVFGEERTGRLEAQLAERIAERTRAEDALADFKLENGVFDLDEQRALLLRRRADLEADSHLCQLDLAAQRLATPPSEEPALTVELPADLSVDIKSELLRQRHDLERELRDLEPGLPDRVVEEASMRLLDLQLEESQLLRDYSEANRRVQSVRAEIANVRSFLTEAERRASTYDQVRRNERAARTQELQVEIDRLGSAIELLVRAERQREQEAGRERLVALETRAGDIAARIAATELEIHALDQHEKTLRQLERALASAEAAAETYQQRTDEARIGAELDREKLINVRVIEKAAAPITPVGLPPKLKLAAGAFVGLLAGAGLALLQDLFRAR